MTTRTRKAPSGAKHARCTSHVEHPYPKSGWLCAGIDGRESADTMRGLPVEPIAEPAPGKAPVKADTVRETRIAVGRYVGVRHIGYDWRAFDRETGADIGPAHRTRRAAVAYALERETTTYGPAPVEPRCLQYLHTQGGTRRCMVEPDLHDGPHDFEPVITSMNGARTPIAQPDTYAAAVELAETRPDPCEACGHPSHGGTCATCQDAAQVGTYAPCAAVATVAAPATVLSTPSASQRPTCERCGQVFRKSGSGAEWHRVNRLDCARVAVAV